MITIDRILCPIDFSDCSRRALDHATAIAHWYDATVTLLHVCTDDPPAAYGLRTPVPPTPGPGGADRDALLSAMRTFAEAEVGAQVPLRYEVAEGHTAAEILALSMSWPSDLLVMGTHGRSGFERLLLGSVTEKVLRRAVCPVLTVPRDLADVVPAPPVLFKHILCAVDFSDCSIHALTYAMSLAQEAGARLTVAHVVELSPDLSPGAHETIAGGPRSTQEFVAEAEAARRARLDDLVPEAVRACCTVDVVTTAGKPYRELLHVATARKSDLIVIGIHGRGATDRLFFGSTAQPVVRQAPYPGPTVRKA